MGNTSPRVYRPYNPRWFNLILRHTVGFYLKVRYRIRTQGTELFDTLSPPYVILPNHVAMIDPLMVASFVPQPVYWIASDSNLRSTVMRNLLRIVGSIPKSKFIPDVETVHTVVNVIRKRGGVVGIYPEGTASFDGHTLPLIPSTAKLIKLLRVPVISVVLRGAYFSMPRWSWFHRRGRIEIHFKQSLSPEEIRQLSVEEILSRLEASILHDESQWEATARVPFFRRALAENLETVLFQCPHCGDIGSMRSSGRTFRCTACGVSYQMDRFYRLRRGWPGGGELVTIRDLSLQQEKSFPLFLKQKMERKKAACLFSDPGVVVLRGRKLRPLSRFRTGRLALFPDRIELRPLSGGRLVFPLSEVEGEGVFQRNNFEFYHNRILYQVRFANRSASALKWLMALRFLHGLTA